MRKSICIALVAAMAMSTPALADQRHGGGRHHDGGRDAALIIGGAILGAVITDATRDRQERDTRPVYRDRDYPYERYEEYPRYRYRDYQCWNHVTTEFDYYGRPYRVVERICR
jgi:hypothetical protein